MSVDTKVSVIFQISRFKEPSRGSYGDRPT